MRELVTESRSVELSEGEYLDVHLVKPAVAETKLPSVIVIHDILGFTADTRRICKQLAEGPLPLVVAAPDLYQGLGPKPVCIIKTISALRKGDGVTFDRLRAVQSLLASLIW